MVLNGQYHTSHREWDSLEDGWRRMEGKGGRRRIREGWKEHEREGGRVKRDEPRRRTVIAD